MAVNFPELNSPSGSLVDGQVMLPDRLERDDGVEWLVSVPYFVLHLVPIVYMAVQGVTMSDLMIAVTVYGVGMFFVTAGYHRYFSHRSYKTSRLFQFILAVGAQLTVQKGVLWWAALHRHHHKHSDTDRDIHSPRRGLYWSHMGWILSKRCNDAPLHLVGDFAKYPELRWLDRLHALPAVALGVTLFTVVGPSATLVGYFLGLVLLWHGTYTINSLAHVIGRVRYQTGDTSKNSLALALLTFGEGWHNNHHYYQVSARQGFVWWEVDVTFYLLKLLSWVGLVWDLRVPPPHVRAGQRRRRPTE
jgi:stearoyl-CoA desaturase (Delta-9 desaturase)